MLKAVGTPFVNVSRTPSDGKLVFGHPQAPQDDIDGGLLQHQQGKCFLMQAANTEG